MQYTKPLDGDQMTTAPTTRGVTRQAWAAAQALAAALRSRLSTPVTGRRWRCSPHECPPWCAADHRCTARLRYPSGEHRSQPLSWDTPYGRLMATRVETIAGVGHLELRATVRLPADEYTARWQAQHLPVGIDLTIRAITAGPTLPTTPTNADAALSAAPRIGIKQPAVAAQALALPAAPRRAA